MRPAQGLRRGLREQAQVAARVGRQGGPVEPLRPRSHPQGPVHRQALRGRRRLHGREVARAEQRHAPGGPGGPRPRPGLCIILKDDMNFWLEKKRLVLIFDGRF